MPTLGRRAKFPSTVIADKVCPSQSTSVCSICCHLDVLQAVIAPSCPALVFCVLEWRGERMGSPRGMNHVTSKRTCSHCTSLFTLALEGVECYWMLLGCGSEVMENGMGSAWSPAAGAQAESESCAHTWILPVWVLAASLASRRGWEELAALCPTHTLPRQVWGCKLRGQGAGDTLGCSVVQSGAFPQAAGESVGLGAEQV